MAANQLKRFFLFSKKERIGIFALLVLLLLLWFAPGLLNKEKGFDEDGYVLFRNDIAHFLQPSDPDSHTTDSTDIIHLPVIPDSQNIQPHTPLFYFDPNTISSEEWKKLGIPNKTIHTIKNFTGKGGRFYKPEDIGKIYGLKKQDYERLLPYVSITKKKSEIPVPVNSKTRNAPEENTKSDISVVNINTADAKAFSTLPGIGEKLAKRIVTFRERLGGFHNTNQIAEVYGLSDTIFQRINPYLFCSKEPIRKININTAGIDELKVHPYIKYQLGNAVIQFRIQHGHFQNMSDLRQIHVITDELLLKLNPYLEY